ncbi:MAG TPA: NAD(P)/FAD-dependent oxidoreductase [Gemmatimonadota bacterium]|nr:NAD(P)/FAD-dependent oxidoreductase [Gemmatimonadota bacterium]
MKPDFDVIVVGASCAGLAAARTLGREGLRTLVLDSRNDFATPKRTWIVTQKLTDVLGCDVRSSVIHETSIMELCANGSQRRIQLERPDLVVERGALRRILACEVEQAGVEIRLGGRVHEVGLESGHVTVAIRNGAVTRLTTRHLIGADGSRSVVAEAFDARPQRTVPIVQARVALEDRYDPNVTRVWFDRDRTRFFYWLIPESPATAVIGMIAERSADARQLLDGFLREHRYRAKEYQGAMIPLHQPRRLVEWRSGRGRVLLVGDAAGHVKVTTVGGVVSGIWGAQAAARALVTGSPYGQELRALHRELYLHDLIRWVMDRFNGRHYDLLLRLMNQELDLLLSTNDRDSMASKTWSLLRAQPRLFLLGMDALLRGARRPA